MSTPEGNGRVSGADMDALFRAGYRDRRRGADDITDALLAAYPTRAEAAYTAETDAAELLGQAVADMAGDDDDDAA